MLNELSIKVNIADRLYPLKVTPEQEVIVRQAAKLIQEKLKIMQSQFEIKDKQDLLSMTILDIATQLLKLQQMVATDEEAVDKQLLEIQKLLKDVSL
ncbi:MAG: cell division protein ZapA [Bacteroidia bacterium]|nr:cell division protein ZapA [Bacteroidia bacterium]